MNVGMVRVGIIGCGSIAIFRHAPEYYANAECEIIGYYDQLYDRAKHLSDKYGGRVYSSADEMLKDESIDAVSVCTSNAFHAPVTIEALRSGKHVLCEKPMATTSNDAVKMIEEAEKAGKFLMIGHNQRLSSAHVYAKQIIMSGEMGKILTFRTVFGHSGPENWSQDKSINSWFFKTDQAFFGATGDLGMHKADLIRWLVGDEVAEVNAFVGTLDKKFPDGALIPVDDNMVACLKFRNGVIGTLTVSWTHYGAEDNSTIIFCEKGIIKIYGSPDYPLEIIKKNGEKILYKIENIQTNVKQSNSGMIDMFINAILKNIKPEISGEEGLAALRIIEACIVSSQRNQTIKL